MSAVMLVLRLLTLIGKELVEIVRRPGALVSLVLGPFLIMVVYGVMSFGAFFGLSDHPKKVALVISGLLGIGVAAGAIFGAIYQVPEPLNVVWIWGVIWGVLGLIVALAVRGRLRSP